MCCIFRTESVRNSLCIFHDQMVRNSLCIFRTSCFLQRIIMHCKKTGSEIKNPQIGDSFFLILSDAKIYPNLRVEEW